MAAPARILDCASTENGVPRFLAKDQRIQCSPAFPISMSFPYFGVGPAQPNCVRFTQRFGNATSPPIDPDMEVPR